ncbi:hypothetical protein CLTEP_22630 [Clostridium tepidiprofundi DSM 19306]|uniref:Uncharacterized protein n=1 Tax=Clostridium tepidiprofundi DSM 19306 TaxID=1121338 RepID=A0A151AX28_9CLOT|nr:hypothetical protein [Clostridium tepidiprofundi]KYH32219.1 hypothetical protein CLTEP_22630 [Clostridium tepidiprofundi DSM 19306]
MNNIPQNNENENIFIKSIPNFVKQFKGAWIMGKKCQKFGLFSTVPFNQSI